ncbi:hypothetical protein [Paralcaligenes ureilyticus]|nr:hypothetical protein [Paralcaligenes ureilyticus]
MEALKEAREIAMRLKQALPATVDAVQQGIDHKTVFYMLVARELSIHRVVALGDDVLALLDSRRYLSASILVRSMLETIAVLGFILRALEKFEKTSDVAVLYTQVQRIIVGSRNGDEKDPSPVHVLDAIRATESFLPVPGLMHVYESISEFAHPNWSGLMGTFGKHENALLVRFSDESRATPPVALWLTIALSSFEHLYDLLGKSILQAAAHFAK